MNKVILTGRLTAAPELRTTNSGKSVTSFTIAVDRITRGEKKADFVRCEAWGSQAENLCRYKTRGDKIAVDGQIRVEKYTDVRGNNVYKTFVLVADVEYLTSRAGEPDDDQKPPSTVDTDNLPEDLPF